MTQLKTLKDFGFNNCSPAGTPDNYKTYYEGDLRAEAIKWIKEEFKGRCNKKCLHYQCKIVDWIKYFFNITDEELK